MADAARLHPEDLRELIEAVKEAVRPPSEWMTFEQACQMLDYTPQYMRRIGIPRHKFGRRVRYRRSEIEAWLATGGRRSA